MILNITTRSVNILFTPLFWVLDETRKKDEESTVENIKKCYEKKHLQGQTPGTLEKRLLIELIGGLAIIGGLASWFYGRLKESKLLKYIGGVLGLGGVGALVTGVVKYFGLNIDGVKEQKNVVNVKPTSHNNTKSDISKAEPSQCRSLVVLDGINPFSDVIENKTDLSASPSYKEQVYRLLSGFSNLFNRKLSDYDYLLNDPRFQVLTLALGGRWVFIGVEAFKVYHSYVNGNLDFETEEGVKFATLDVDEKAKEYCKVLEIGLDATEAEIKKAYRKQAMKYHPDRNPGSEDEQKKVAIMFCKVTDAYQYLIDRCKIKSNKA